MLSGRRSLDVVVFVLLSMNTPAWSAPAKLSGVLHLTGSNKPLPGVEVKIVETGQTAVSGAAGEFVFDNVAPGTYTLEASQQGFVPLRQRITVAEPGLENVHLEMNLAALSVGVVVTASPYTQETFRTYQPTGTLEGKELEARLSGSLAETLKDQPGVHMRSFGPGPARPVIRGFDGDRVLVVQDGNRVGDLSSQSGDHGVPIDPASLERIEVVRGPASLLFGSNAIGGVVNTITSDIGHTSPFRGTTGHARVEGGTVNSEGAVNGHVDVGTGSWIFHAGGGGRRTGNYATPLGIVPNSSTRTGTVQTGIDYVRDRGSLRFNFGYDDLEYGIPFAGFFEGEEDAVIRLGVKRRNFQFRGGLKDLAGPFRALRFTTGFNDYKHEEREDGEVVTTFNNDLFEYQAFFDQRERGRLSGTIGIWGLHRKYDTIGEEALAPLTTQNSFALFGYEELAWEHVKLQFGGRLDHTGYAPVGLEARDFTGFSGSVGILADVAPKTVLAANYALAYRAPALEELYNNGPHVGNLSFEIGNARLERELGNGFDLALRHRRDRVRGEINFFQVRISDFIFGAPTGEIEDGLPVFEFEQADSRFTGFEAGIDLGIREWLWLNLGADYVRAGLIDSNEPLPRIPPLRGRAGLEIRHKGFSFQPELVAASKQDRVFSVETPTSGYTVFNLRAAYSWTAGRLRHTITAGLFNAGDRLYRNHLSFIKQLAPEYGRSFKMTYTFDFF